MSIQVSRIPGDLASVRRTQQEIMRTAVKVTLKSTEIPESVRYLHGLVMNGLGDSYNYYDGAFIIYVNLADKIRYPQLSKVESIMLEYAGAPIEKDLEDEQ